MTRPLFDAKRVFGVALARWEGLAGPLEVLGDRDNLVCAVSRGASRHVLRLTHSDRRTEDQVTAEMHFVDYLAREGVDVATPLPSRSGSLVERVEARSGYFSACLLTWAPGQRVTYRSSLWTEPMIGAWGRTLGRIHALSRTYEPLPEAPRFSWRDDDVWANALTYLPARETVARERRVELQPRLERLPQAPESFGMIHGDLGSANFHVEGQRLVVFDFDDCCLHWYAYDIAVALWAYRLLGPDDRQRHRTTWLQGYQSVCALEPLWLPILDLFFELRALYLLARSYRDAEPDRNQELDRRARNGWRRLLEDGFTW